MSTTYKTFPHVLSSATELWSCSIRNARLIPNWLLWRKGLGKARAKAPIHWPMVTRGELETCRGNKNRMGMDGKQQKRRERERKEENRKRKGDMRIRNRQERKKEKRERKERKGRKRKRTREEERRGRGGKKKR